MSDLERDSEYYLRKEENVPPGQHDKRAVLLTRSLNKLHDPGICYDLATVSYRKGDYHKAIKKYRLTINIDPEFCLAYNAWGFCLSHLKRYDEAIFKFKEALNIDPGHGLASLNWGLILFWLERKDAAEEIVEEGMRHNQVDQDIIVNAYELELSSDERKLEKANSEEEKKHLEGRIAGYRWILELISKKVEKVLDSGENLVYPGPYK